MKNKDATIIPVIKVGAGLDVHKDKIVICVIQVKGKTFFEEFGTSTAELHKIVKYLQDLSVERCVMESTGVYWLSIYSLIEEQGIETVLVNPAYIKQLPGRKTDINDSQWLCRLLINGMVKGSGGVSSLFWNNFRLAIKSLRMLFFSKNSGVNRMTYPVGLGWVITWCTCSGLTKKMCCGRMGYSLKSMMCVPVAVNDQMMV
jgi:hypothetical protein